MDTIKIYKVCPKCNAEGQHDRGEEIVDPCDTCGGVGYVETKMFIDITSIMDKLGEIKGKIKDK